MILPLHLNLVIQILLEPKSDANIIFQFYNSFPALQGHMVLGLLMNLRPVLAHSNSVFNIDVFEHIDILAPFPPDLVFNGLKPLLLVVIELRFDHLFWLGESLKILVLNFLKFVFFVHLPSYQLLDRFFAVSKSIDLRFHVKVLKYQIVSRLVGVVSVFFKQMTQFGRILLFNWEIL